MEHLFQEMYRDRQRGGMNSSYWIMGPDWWNAIRREVGAVAYAREALPGYTTLLGTGVKVYPHAGPPRLVPEGYGEWKPVFRYSRLRWGQLADMANGVQLRER